MIDSTDSFPNAPHGWTPKIAAEIAGSDGIELTNDHLELIRALQEYYQKAENPNLRQIKDALNEKFHHKGGMKYLYQIVPGGPVAQGCKLAGLKVPPVRNFPTMNAEFYEV